MGKALCWYSIPKTEKALERCGKDINGGDLAFIYSSFVNWFLMMFNSLEEYAEEDNLKSFYSEATTSTKMLLEKLQWFQEELEKIKETAYL